MSKSKKYTTYPSDLYPHGTDYVDYWILRLWDFEWMLSPLKRTSWNKDLVVGRWRAYRSERGGR